MYLKPSIVFFTDITPLLAQRLSDLLKMWRIISLRPSALMRQARYPRPEAFAGHLRVPHVLSRT